MKRLMNTPAAMFLLAACVFLGILILTRASEASDAGKLRVYATMLVLLIASAYIGSGKSTLFVQAITSLAMGMTVGSSMLMFFAAPAGVLATILSAIGFVAYIVTVSKKTSPSWPVITIVSVLGILAIAPWS